MMKQYRTDSVLSAQLPRLPQGWRFKLVITGSKFTVYAVGTGTDSTKLVLEGNRADVSLAEIRALKHEGAETEQT